MTRKTRPPPPPAANAPTRRTLSRGTVLDRYVIIERVGAGGFGEVFAAYDPDLDRKVALKLMKTRVNRLGSARAQLLREAQALAKLSHENVTTIYDFGEFEDDVFISMEFVDGLTLKAWFAEEARTWQEVRDVMVAAGRGLAAAHAAGIIHSDFKPHNVLVDKRGSVTVADFGLAKAMLQFDPPDDVPDNVPGHGKLRRRATTIPSVRKPGDRGREPMAGSPAYMSPEQFRGQGVDERSDQFSFCVALFEGLFGRRPFPQTNFTELRIAIEEGNIEHPEDERDVPRWIKDVVLRGLSRDAHERFDSMDELLAALSDDPDAKRKQRMTIATTAIVSATLAGGITALFQTDPTMEELGHIDSLVVEAKDAAARNFFVHPPVDAPGTPTAYTKVLELERLDGVFDPRADERAAELRQEFAETLTRVGDYYWAAEYGKSFALDYYAQAVIFDPDQAHARERAGTTIGELANLRRKAANLDFTRSELIAAEPLSALATTKVEERASRLRKLVDKRRRRSTTGQESLDAMSKIMTAVAKSKQYQDTVAPDITSMGVRLPNPEDAVVRSALQPVKVETKKSKRKDPRGSEAPAPRPSTTRADLKASARLVDEARVQLDRGKFKAAEQLAHRALRAHRRNARALMTLCDVYFEMGELHKAVEYGERGVEIDPKRREYHRKLGEAYQRVHRYEDAIAAYEFAAKRGSKRAQRRLRNLRKRLGDK